MLQGEHPPASNHTASGREPERRTHSHAPARSSTNRVQLHTRPREATPCTPGTPSQGRRTTPIQDRQRPTGALQQRHGSPLGGSRPPRPKCVLRHIGAAPCRPGEASAEPATRQQLALNAEPATMPAPSQRRASADASADASAEPAPRQQLALNAAALREQGSRRAPAMLQRSSSGQPEGASPERRSGQSASRPAAQACSAPVTSSTRHTAPVPREAAGCKPASGPSPRRQGTRAAGSWLTRASGPSPRRRGTHEPPEAGSRALRGRRP